MLHRCSRSVNTRGLHAPVTLQSSNCLCTSLTSMANRLLFLFFALIHHAVANVEKTLFVAPTAEPLPQDASIDNLLLTRLSDQHPSVRTSINASFPTAESPKGTETWLLMEGLLPQKRYEVRICWLATVGSVLVVQTCADSSQQPTSFWLFTHSVNKVFETPELLMSLSAYSYARHERLTAVDRQSLQLRKPDFIATDSTFLFLQIFAAADYFSLNETLMKTVPPVAADVILDPYVLNILPKSLVPIGLYLLLIATGSWFLSVWIFRLLANPVDGRPRKESKKSK